MKQKIWLNPGETLGSQPMHTRSRLSPEFSLCGIYFGEAEVVEVEVTDYMEPNCPECLRIAGP